MELPDIKWIIYAMFLSTTNRGEPDITMFGTTSLASFHRFVAGVEIDSIVKVLYKHKPDREVGHLVVIGPGGFQLCTCLQLPTCTAPFIKTIDVPYWRVNLTRRMSTSQYFSQLSKNNSSSFQSPNTPKYPKTQRNQRNQHKLFTKLR